MKKKETRQCYYCKKESDFLLNVWDGRASIHTTPNTAIGADWPMYGCEVDICIPCLVIRIKVGI